MSWEKVKLGDVTDSCLGKMLDQAKNKGEYQPYLANVDVRWGSFNLDNLSEMRFEDDEQDRYGLKYGDLVICEGGEPGRCAIWKDQIPNMKIQKALHRVRVHECLDNRYLYYWFLLAGKTGALEQYFTGATIKHMPGQKLKSVLIDIPPIEVQHRIADILWVYDDLIENNQKQIKLLEEAAQRLYKEWFVDLRFPGHETTPITDGIPQGWCVHKIGERFDTYLGGPPSRAQPQYWQDGTIPWINSGKVNELRVVEPSEYITELALNKSATKLLPVHTTLVAITGATLGQVSYTEITTCANQSVVGIVDPSTCYEEYIYCYVSNNIKQIISKATGGAQQHINKDIVNAFDIVLPNEKLMASFKNQIAPLFEKIKNLLFQNIRLTEARDRLLPKLMNGEIEV